MLFTLKSAVAACPSTLGRRLPTSARRVVHAASPVFHADHTEQVCGLWQIEPRARL